jgi:hypothetical protein
MIFLGVRPALATWCSLSSAQGTHSHTHTQALFLFSPSLSSLLPFCKPGCNDTTRHEELGPPLLFLSPVLRSPDGDALLGRWAPLSYPGSLCLALFATARERLGWRFGSIRVGIGMSYEDTCLLACVLAVHHGLLIPINFNYTPRVLDTLSMTGCGAIRQSLDE